MLKVTQEIIEAVIKNQEKIYGGAISPNWNITEQVKENFSEEVAKKNWEDIKRYIKINKKMKILDLGCGYGFFVAYLRKMNLECFGCDVDEESVKIARSLLRINNDSPKHVSVNSQRELPYPSGTFDLINLNYVLLYVKNWDMLFKEIYRVLKDDGKVYLITPNYQCGYDVNYGLFLIYWLPKWLNKIYLRLMGRKNLIFFDTFNFTTKTSLEKLFKRHGFLFEDIGIKNWLESLEKHYFENRSLFYRKIILLTDFLNLKILLKFFSKMGFYTPLIYLLSKNSD